MTNPIFPTLFSRTKTGAIQQWTVEVDGAKHRTISGQVDGLLVTKAWTVTKGKNVGKANETTPEQQAILEAQAKWDKKIKEFYVEDIAKIDSFTFKEPQLAKPTKGTNYIEQIDWSTGPCVDLKLNGICCISMNGKCLSRKNEEFFAIHHIAKELDIIFREFPSAYIHGELFNPKYVTDLNKLAEIVAVTRKEKDIDNNLLSISEQIVQYWIYDGYGFGGINQEDGNLDRRLKLVKFIEENNFKYIKAIQYTRCYSLDEMINYFTKYVKTGGEGVIIRDVNAPYVHKRTKALLKYKKSESQEFKIISLEEGTADWQGCAKFAWCELPDGKRDNKFKTNIKGSQEKLKEAYSNRDKYVGKMITVEFQEYSEYNVPLIPYTDLLIRDYEG